MTSTTVIRRWGPALRAPEQAEAMIQGLRQRCIPVTQLAFPDEGHRLRRPDSIRRAIEAELTFTKPSWLVVLEAAGANPAT